MAVLPGNAVDLFWAKDTQLWSNGRYEAEIPEFMGWINVALTMEERVKEINEFTAEVIAAGFERVILAGMGGSSLAPLVLQQCLASNNGLPLEVLDSTDPATVLRIESAGPIEKALVVISSKSGSTAEPNAFNDYLYAQIQAIKGGSAGENFVAITDPDSPFESHAKELGFRKIFLNFPDIGGRYSALSYFGMVPASLMGIDIAKLLERAVAIVDANGPGRSVHQALAVELGLELGEHALAGRNKLTFILPEELRTVGLWMEQLVAESTGKEGRGILPIALERIAPASHYGHDRVFAYIYEIDHPHPLINAQIAALRDAGQPVISIGLTDRYDIASEFMRWEIATAIAGAVIEINPFDQPNVQESKDITKRYVKLVEDQGSLPPETPTVTEGELAVYGGSGSTIEECFTNFLAEVKQGDYICLQCYLTETHELSEALMNLQASLRDRYKAPCTNGYGPRFLHSTGQFHKGGPNTGHFIQFTQDDSVDVNLAGKSYTFGTFRNAQTRGDKDALLAHNRKVIHFHLGSNPIVAVEHFQKVSCNF